MTIDELRALAEERPHLYLVIPRDTLPSGDGIRLAGRRGPIGRICTVKSRGENEFYTKGPFDIIAVFKSDQILAFLGPP